MFRGCPIQSSIMISLWVYSLKVLYPDSPTQKFKAAIRFSVSNKHPNNLLVESPVSHSGDPGKHPPPTHPDSLLKC